MAKKGTFQIISESYQIGAKNLFKYCKSVVWILKPFLCLYAIFVFVVLYISSWVFYILIIFDFLAKIVNSLRNFLFNSIDAKSENVKYSLIGFVINPLIIVILTLIFILSAIIPKISSELNIDELTGSALNEMDITGSGTFKQIIKLSMKTISNLFVFIKGKKLLFWPFLIVFCLFNSLLMLALILIATPLLILDFLSYIVDSIRNFCSKISRNLGNSIEKGFGRFIFSPIILVLLVPVFIVVLIIPKFSTAIDIVN